MRIFLQILLVKKNNYKSWLCMCSSIAATIRIVSPLGDNLPIFGVYPVFVTLLFAFIFWPKKKNIESLPKKKGFNSSLLLINKA